MKTKEFKHISCRNLFRHFPIWLPLIAAPVLWSSCDEDDLSRKTNLLVSTTPEKDSELLTGLKCEIYGGRDTLYVFSNVDYDLFFQTSYKEDGDWLKIISKTYNPQIKADEVIIECAPMTEKYVKRDGSLSFTSKDNYLGQFLSVRQGYVTEIAEDFSWLKAGTPNPFEMTQDINIADWTTAQTEKGWTSTVYDGREKASCFAKLGYLRLGEEGSGADLITPPTSHFVSDSVVMLTFQAVAYTSLEEVKDQNTLHVNILNGGAFLDGSTSKTIQLNHIDPTDRKVIANMWKNNQYEFYVVSKESNPLSGDTKIQFVTGDYSSATGNNRIFIDNIYAYIVDKEFYYLATLPSDEEK